ncbi:MAG: arginase family protein, partial [Planctomycetota bacterium]
LTLLQFDAHPNLRSSYENHRFGRMTVMNRLYEDLPITQVGIRCLNEEEANLTDKGNVSTFFMHDIQQQALKSELIPSILEGLSSHVYVSLDMTVFDPALCPGTNLPEPGGMSWNAVLDVLRAVARERDIVAMDVVEIAPIPGSSITEYVAARMVYKVMGFLAQFRQWPEMEV